MSSSSIRNELAWYASERRALLPGLLTESGASTSSGTLFLLFFLNNHFEVGFILTKLKRNFYTRSLFHTLSIYSNNMFIINY